MQTCGAGFLFLFVRRAVCACMYSALLRFFRSSKAHMSTRWCALCLLRHFVTQGGGVECQMCKLYIIIALKELLLLIMYTTVIIMIWILKSRICMTYKCMSPINMLQNVARHMHVYRLTKKKFASLSNKFHHSDIISVVCSG